MTGSRESSFTSIGRRVIHSLTPLRSSSAVKTTTVLLVAVTVICLFYRPTSNNQFFRHDLKVQEKNVTSTSTAAALLISEQYYHHVSRGCESSVSEATLQDDYDDYVEEDDDDDDDDEAFEMPSWMSAYVEFHKRHIQKTLTGSFQYKDSNSSNNDDNGYIKWTCQEGKCGGLGDRLYGIVMTLYMAMLTNRTLIVQGWNDNDSNACPLDSFIRPAYIQWNAVVVNDDDSQVDDDVVDDANDSSSLPAVFHVSTLDNRSHPYLQQPCTSIPTNYKRIEIQNNIMTYDSILKNNSNNNHNCFMDYWKRHHPDKRLSHHNDDNDEDNDNDTDDDNRSLFHVGFWTLFRFTPRVYRHADYLREMARMTKTMYKVSKSSDSSHDDNDATIRRHPRQSSSFRPYIGVHIRTGQGETWNDPIRHGSSTETLQLFYQCALKLQHGMHQIQQQQQEQQQQQTQYRCPNATNSSNHGTTAMTSSHMAKGDSTTTTTATLPPPPLPLPDIYIASDNAATKMQIQHWGNNNKHEQQEQQYNSIKTLVDLDILHIDKTRVDDLQRNSIQTDNKETAVQQAYMNVWGELQILRDATCLVTSRSKFSDLAVELNSHHHHRGRSSSAGYYPQSHAQSQSTRRRHGRCAVAFDDCGNEQVARALQNYNGAQTTLPIPPPPPPPPQRPCV